MTKLLVKLREIGVVKLVKFCINIGKKYWGASDFNYKQNTEEEFDFIRRLLGIYYNIESESSQKEKYNNMSELLSNDIDPNFLDEFKNTLDLYVKSKASRSFSLKKVLRNKEEKSTYKVFLEMTSKFPKEKIKTFLMEVDLVVSANVIQQNSYTLSHWGEKVLTRAPEVLTSTTILADQNSYTELRLPCNFQHIGPVKNHENVALNLESRNKLIKFKLRESLTDTAKYRASCKSHIFELDLVTDDKAQTIYHAFNMSDGTKKFKKLSEREKLIRTLESHMDVKVQR